MNIIGLSTFSAWFIALLALLARDFFFLNYIYTLYVWHSTYVGANVNTIATIVRVKHDCAVLKKTFSYLGGILCVVISVL